MTGRRAQDDRDDEALDGLLLDDEGDELIAEDDADGALDVADEREGPEHRRIRVRRDPRTRLDKYLQSRLPRISRNQLQKLITLGGVTVNDKPPKASTLIRQGDVLDIILPPTPARYLKPEPIPIDALYEDEHFIVINKQADLIVHPARSHLSGTLINGLAYHFMQQRGGQARVDPSQRTDGTVEGLSTTGADECRPGIVHRLDKHTTGVMVVAKSDEAHWQIAVQFEHRQTLKAYLALVHGNFDTVGGVIDQPLGRHPTIREAQAVRHDSRGKASVTLYRVREQYRGYSLVELELRTGRTHQIRVHLSYLGRPIVGDMLYGGEAVGPAELDDPPEPAGVRTNLTFARSKEQWEKLEAQLARRDDLLLRHPALHAAVLGLTHPIRKQWMTFVAPMHEPMGPLVRELRKRRIDAPVATEGCHVDLDAVITQR